MNRQDFQAAVASLPFGKVLPGARYLYLPPESTLDSPLAPLIARLRDRLGLASSHHIIKLAHADFAISFLDYPDFLTHPHPDLHEAIRIQLATGAIKRINFSSHANPPILHRKESFLPPDHPLFPLFASLTQAEEAAGLYKDTSRIGFRDNWEEILRSRQLTIIGHSLHTTNTTGEERSGDIPVRGPDRGPRGLENPRSFPAASSTTGLSHSAPTTGEERSADIPVGDLDRGPRGLENPRSFPAASSTTGLSHSAPTTGEERSADIPVGDLDRGPRGLENPRSFPAASSTTGLSHSAPHAPPVILRHRTALARSELSKPIRTALASSLLRPSDSVFDFGCGHGTDVAALNAYGIPAAGWDPAFFPHNPITPASFVNLGFVLNVIESPAERVDVLQHAWKLTSRVLLVSTMIRGQEDYSVSRPHADGYITSRSTFQKYFDPSELQGLIEHALDADAHPAGLGIYAVFRNPQDAQDWLAEKIRRPVDWDTLSRKLGFLRPSIARRAVDAYEANRELLDACWLRMLDLGRFPTPDEFDRFHDLKSKVGSPRTVTRIFTTRFGDATLESARQLRRDDLLAYLALANFHKKIPLKYLSDKLQADIRSFFGTYEGALASARELLFSAGNSRNIEAACEGFPHGHQDEDALQIHRSLLKDLPAILRVYVLCAARVYGDPDDADIIKIHKHSGKVSFQYYEGFVDDPFPPLLWRIKINLRRLSADVFDHRVPPHQQLLCPGSFTLPRPTHHLRWLCPLRHQAEVGHPLHWAGSASEAPG